MSTVVAAAFHVETVLDKSETEASSAAVFRGVGCVEEVGEEETNDLEGHRDHAVPDKREYGSNG